jgi:hypothetical protein
LPKGFFFGFNKEMIERLLRMQTIDGPYLGVNRPLEASPPVTKIQSFLLPEPKAQAPKPLVLQSIGQQLHIQQAQKNITMHQNQMHQSAQNIIRQTLTPVTLSALQGQTYTSALSLSPEELFLLGLLRSKGGAKRSDQWVPNVSPNASAQLSFIETPRVFLRTLPRARKLRLRGISFMNFRFQWEDEPLESPTAEQGMLE